MGAHNERPFADQSALKLRALVTGYAGNGAAGLGDLLDLFEVRLNDRRTLLGGLLHLGSNGRLRLVLEFLKVLLVVLHHGLDVGLIKLRAREALQLGFGAPDPSWTGLSA